MLFAKGGHFFERKLAVLSHLVDREMISKHGEGALLASGSASPFLTIGTHFCFYLCRDISSQILSYTNLK